jgi:hypothetical protein
MSGKPEEISDANHGAFAIVSVLCVPVRGFSGGLFDLLHTNLDNAVLWGVVHFPSRMRFEIETSG